MEVPVQKAGPVVRGLLSDDVHGPLPQLGPLGVPRRTHSLRRGPRLIGTGPCLHGHRQPVNTQQLAGQQIGTPVRPLITQAHGPRQQGHQQGRVIAVLRRRVHTHQRGRGHVRIAEQAQNVRLAAQQPLRVPQEEGFDERPQNHRAPTARPGDVQTSHFRRPPATKPHHAVDVLARRQRLLHPGPRRTPAANVKMGRPFPRRAPQARQATYALTPHAPRTVPPSPPAPRGRPVPTARR
jgi:hypothetical protein